MTDKHEHKTCGCSHGHGHENKTCGCGHDHEHEHEKCGCTCGCDGKGGGLSLWIRAGMTGACWIGGHAIFHNWVKILLFSVALFIIGYDVLWSAIKGVVKGKVFGETLLMTIAAVAAAVIGEWHEAIAVLLLFQIGEALQGYCTKKTENRVLSLVSLNVDTAVLIADGEAREVAAQSVTVGSIVEVRAGAKVPLDGVVQEGESTLDTSMLTGESLPVFVKRGDKIYGGSINGGGRLLVRTTAAFSDGAAQKILSMVQSAAGRKAKSQKFITAFARIYTPVVCFAAICLAFLPLAFGQSIQVWGRRALVFLVSSCPCALVISVPLAYFAGIGKAAANGVLVKGGTQLDALAKMRAIATDKTGTLTDGRMQVLRVQGEDERQTIALAAAVERYSDHPLARAICEFAKGIALPDVHSTEERAGQGMVATYRGKTLVVGSRRLLASHGIRVEDGDGTTVHVALGDVCVGAIVLGDRAKEGAKEALAALRQRGAKRQVMLTGDSRGAAERVAVQVGVGEIYASLLPDGKVRELEKIQKQSGVTAFVGDGINDAPALTAADVGIAMGGLGSDAAIEVADVVVSDDDLQRIPRAVFVARKTRAIVKENVGMSIAVKLAVMALGAVGIAPMWLAVLADVGICLVAIGNCLRLVFGKGKSRAAE